MKVTVEMDGNFAGHGQVFRNITEVHYKYPTLDAAFGPRIAFESDIHGTGFTYALSDIKEFEVVPETELAEEI